MDMNAENIHVSNQTDKIVDIVYILIEIYICIGKLKHMWNYWNS